MFLTAFSFSLPFCSSSPSISLSLLFLKRTSLGLKDAGESGGGGAGGGGGGGGGGAVEEGGGDDSGGVGAFGDVYACGTTAIGAKTFNN